MITVSCDPYGGYEYWVDNKTDSIIFVELKEKNSIIIDKVIIYPKSNQILKKYYSINGLYDYGNDFLKYWDSLVIMVDTTSRSKIKKDYLKRDSWIYQQNETGKNGFVKAGDNIYKLNFNNEDLN